MTRPPMDRPALPALDGWWAKDADGKTITRERTCECGHTYTQHLLGPRFLGMAERHSMGAVDAVMRDVPDLFVPVHCPPCERRAITHHPLPAEQHTRWQLPIPRRLTDRARFARNLGQLCAAWNKPMDDETSASYWRALERAMTDDEFETGVLAAIRTERKWPVPATIAQHGRAA